jgi:hypothetical protein
MLELRVLYLNPPAATVDEAVHLIRPSMWALRQLSQIESLRPSRTSRMFLDKAWRPPASGLRLSEVMERLRMSGRQVYDKVQSLRLSSQSWSM